MKTVKDERLSPITGKRSDGKKTPSRMMMIK
jgi:hypothetical protein